MNFFKQHQSQETLEKNCKIHNLDFIGLTQTHPIKHRFNSFVINAQIIKRENLIIQSLITRNNDKRELSKTQLFQKIFKPDLQFQKIIRQLSGKDVIQIQKYISHIQKEEQELQDYESELNYLEDIKIQQNYILRIQKNQRKQRRIIISLKKFKNNMNYDHRYSYNYQRNNKRYYGKQQS
ncbi:unnamed protein product [Paramecium sonneborni]|uniref:Uncharacterized protein n=1 Tax=Paramecium sonneborni TaxID=65129 RepID=A0A8S1RRD9_9CILI|nr:unnamed protein product [Paramecium sonneborni]